VVTLHLDAGDDGPKRLWLDEDVGDPSADVGASLVSLGYIRAALRRSRRFWYATAIAGLLIGAGLYVASPHAYQASTTLYLTVGSESVPGTAILEDQAIAQSRSVARLALHKLGLGQSVDGFLGSYTATVVTDRVLNITANAPSSNEAVRRANAVAKEFLTFRTNQLQAQQRLQFAGLDQQISQGKQHIKSLINRISQLSAQPTSPKQQVKLNALQAQRDRAESDLTALKQATSSDKASTQLATASMIQESEVLDPASPLQPPSHVKHLILYAVAGCFIGLVLGVSIVVVRALVSDRLRRRDDVAHALGAPVKLSVPVRRVSRRHGLAAAHGRDMQRIVAYLRGAVPASSRGAAALAVVPVDDPQVAALSVVSLAVSGAQQGKKVVVADLSGDAPAAMLLGVKDPGVHMVSVESAHLVAAVSDPDEIAPIGPFRPTSPRAQSALASQLAAACASADLLLVLVTLDPSLDAEHLATWAADAVVFVTAGRSSWTKAHAVGEMIRLAGVRVVSAVLVGADETDESLGVTRTLDASRDAVGREGLPSEPESSFAAVNGGSGASASDDRPTGTAHPRSG
jgi:capsular polysaccharide biosynthesis protein